MHNWTRSTDEPVGQWETRALVVDDYEDFLRLLCASLEEMGIRCERATSGAEAEDLLETVLFDLLVVDKNLPDMDGIAVARRARLIHPDLPVLLITGYASEESAHRAAIAGVADYIQKPFDLDSFSARVRALTGPQPASVRHSPFAGHRGTKVSTVPPSMANGASERLTSWSPRPVTENDAGEKSGVVSVLLVEPDVELRDALAGLLEDINCEVVALAAPEMAEALEDKPQFDMLIARPEVLSSRKCWLEPREGRSPLGSMAIVDRGGLDGIVEAIRLGARGALAPPFERAVVTSEFTGAVSQLIEERYGAR